MSVIPGLFVMAMHACSRAAAMSAMLFSLLLLDSPKTHLNGAKTGSKEGLSSFPHILEVDQCGYVEAQDPNHEENFPLGQVVLVYP